MLQRMRELAVQSMNGTYSDTQRSYLNKEFQGLTEQIDRISTDTMWNDQKLLAGGGYRLGSNSDFAFNIATGILVPALASAVDYTGATIAAGNRYYPSAAVFLTGQLIDPPFAGNLTSAPAIYSGVAVNVYTASGTLLGWSVPKEKLHATFTVQAGKDEDQTISVDIGPMNIRGFGLSGLGIATFDTATSTLNKISTALEQINNQRAGIGAAINQMAFGADNLTNISSNATQSRSTIMDTDYALATTQLAKTQIIQQAATAMLAQANQQPQSVMALLKG